MRHRASPDAVQETLALYPEPLGQVAPPQATVGRIPPEDSPRRRLIEGGPATLSATELLTLVCGSERPAIRDAAEAALSTLGGLFGLGRASVEDLASVPGIGDARAALLVAAAELGRRMSVAQCEQGPQISSPQDILALLAARLSHLDREHFVCVLLDTKHRVMSTKTISVGTLSAALIHPREVFRPAVKAGAASVVVAHNHPSGDPAPSPEDKQTTTRLLKAGEIFGIPVLDHVIIGAGCHFSFKEHGLI